MNVCHFIGRFCHDPELRTINKGDGKETVVTNFTLSISRKFKKNNGELGKQTSYIDCELWDSGAKIVSQNFRKDDFILVHASARNDNYTTTDGKKMSKIKFRVESFESLPQVYAEKEEVVIN